MSAMKPDLSIPAGDAPSELVLEDITVGDGKEAVAGTNVKCITSVLHGALSANLMRRGIVMRHSNFVLARAK